MTYPPKNPDLMTTIKECIESGRYLDTRHAKDRKKEREITRSDLIYVLLHGHHEAKKDRFEIEFDAWNYSIKGKSIDKDNLRVIVSFDKNGMLIITAIKL